MGDEQVTIMRASASDDAYGDPSPGKLVQHLSLVGKFAPNNPDEPVEVGRTAVIKGGTVYARLPSVPDIRATDSAVIRGVTYAIDGEVGVWRGHSGFGVQFAVKAVGDA